MKGNGKLMWKSEGASQWSLWKVVSEGAGKEYQVPNSAYWVNHKICEQVLDFPAPEYFFYEHLFVDGVKMSASLGNVIYPSDWLKVATPQLLRFFYNKRLMMSRSFSWKDLPVLYDEEDYYAGVSAGEIILENKKEEAHIKRLFQISHGHAETRTCPVSFSHAIVVSQISNKDEDIVKSLKKTGQYDDARKDIIWERIGKVRRWLDKYAPVEAKFEVMEEIPKGLSLSSAQKKALHTLAGRLLEKEWQEKELFEEIYAIAKELGMQGREVFEAGYRVLLDKTRGPKLAPFILMLGREKVAGMFKEV